MSDFCTAGTLLALWPPHTEFTSVELDRPLARDRPTHDTTTKPGKLVSAPPNTSIGNIGASIPTFTTQPPPDHTPHTPTPQVTQTHHTHHIHHIPTHPPHSHTLPSPTPLSSNVPYAAANQEWSVHILTPQGQLHNTKHNAMNSDVTWARIADYA
jgi:hypothetical protein